MAQCNIPNGVLVGTGEYRPGLPSHGTLSLFLNDRRSATEERFDTLYSLSPLTAAVENREINSFTPCIYKVFSSNMNAKYVALILLVAQTVGSIVLMRMSRLTKGDDGLKYINTTAVVMSEILKLLGSLILVWKEANFSSRDVIQQIDQFIVQNIGETLKVGVPALLYTIQNNLIFIALSNMSPALYQVTYQMKILTTALLSTIMLKRRLGLNKWIALFVLTVGVTLIQFPNSGGTQTSSLPSQGNALTGFIAVSAACFTSGFAGVYFEKILKSSSISIWIRNIQLSIFGIAIGLIGVWWNDGGDVASRGFFQGYTYITWLVILLQSAGGLIVAAVLKYADNILKCFGNAVAIVLSCLFSYILLEELELTQFFLVGTTLVISATYAYGTDMILSNFLPRKILSLCKRRNGYTQSEPDSDNEATINEVKIAAKDTVLEMNQTNSTHEVSQDESDKLLIKI